MPKLLARIALAAMLSAASGAHAQAPTPLEPAARINLTLEQRHMIKELIKDLKIEPTQTAVRPSLGEALPQDVALHPVPTEIGQRVPQIKAHKFLLTADQIVIVDAKDNKVAEVIELKAD
jgi:hypothetical protein